MKAPPESLRVMVEAAFPGARIEPDGRYADWCIVPPDLIEIEGVPIATISVDGEGRVSAFRVGITPASIASMGLPRHVIERRLHSPTAHELLAARRRLGL